MQICPRCCVTYPDEVSQCPVDGSTLVPSGTVLAPDPALESGTMVGEYRLDRKLGTGTFGDVYAAEQPLIGKRVAIKLLHRRFSSDPEVVSRFISEARAVNRIRHKHIIDIFSFGLLGERRHYFVMELLDGLTLGELLEREGRLPVDVAIPIFRGIASGLDAAHQAGITHRDLKPDNVFLAILEDGSHFAKLLDFGVAKLRRDDGVAHKTATGVAMGTPRYMSPEQSRGVNVDHRADIYSLGVLIHEVLTGQPLFEGDSSMDVLFKHANTPPPSMSSVLPGLPAELDEPVLAMLAKRPRQRPASAREAVSALAERALSCGRISSLPVSADLPRSAPRALTPPKTETDDTMPVTPDGRTAPVRGEHKKARTVSNDIPAVEMRGANNGPDSGREIVQRATADAATAAATSAPLESAAVSEAAASSDPSAPGAASGPGSAAASSAEVTLRAAEPPARKPSPWMIVGVVAAIAIAAVLLSRRGEQPPSAAPASQTAPASATITASPQPSAAITVQAASTASATSSATAAVSTAAPSTAAPVSTAAPHASATTAPARHAAPAKPKYHDDLEAPKELSRP